MNQDRKLMCLAGRGRIVAGCAAERRGPRRRPEVAHRLRGSGKHAPVRSER